MWDGKFCRIRPRHTQTGDVLKNGRVKSIFNHPRERLPKSYLFVAISCILDGPLSLVLELFGED